MSKYIDTVLETDENIEYEATISLWSMWPFFLPAAIFIPSIFILNPQSIIGLILIAIGYMKYKTTEFVITNKKIIAKSGLITQKTIELLLPQTESIQIKQSILGRIFNYGSIVVSGAGNPQAPVPGICNPMQCRKKFMEIKGKS